MSRCAWRISAISGVSFFCGPIKRVLR
jgi:hypothetical protein